MMPWLRPDVRRISTSHIERANLSVRMHLRRLTRLTNAFSKKLTNLEAAVTLYVAFYNFCCVHKTLGMTPARFPDSSGSSIGHSHSPDCRLCIPLPPIESKIHYHRGFDCCRTPLPKWLQ